MWRVKGETRYYDANADPPKKPTGKWDDRFANDGVADTFGCHFKWGEAIFIPEKDFKGFPRFRKEFGIAVHVWTTRTRCTPSEAA